MRLRKKTPEPDSEAFEEVRASRAPAPVTIPSRNRPDADGLNPQQRRFAEEYLLTLNATQAAIKAGYSAKTAASNGCILLRHPKVAAFIQQQQLADRERFNVSRERLVGEAGNVAFASVKDFTTLNEDGSPVFDFRNMTDSQWSAINSLTIEEFKDGRSDKRQVRRIKAKQESKLAAIELMAKLLGFMKEEVTHKHDHQHTVLGNILLEIDAEARAKTIEHKADEGDDER